MASAGRGGSGLIVIMGSGETAPTMVKVHREVVAASTTGPAVMLDTTFGFQLNADDLVARTRAYFAEAVGVDIRLASWRDARQPPLECEQSLALIARASWVFAGPGSPTYALGQWEGTPVPGALADVVERGGTLVFGSAAACTLGTHAIPVYEIYKAGATPHWVPGLDLLGRLAGIEAVVVPHFDNAEGGHYDTRFCYLGEPRLAGLEAQLPDEVGVLGVDEHTAVVIDLEDETASVRGSGVVTVRRRGRATELGDGERVALRDLGAMLRGETAAPAPVSRSTPRAEVAPPPATSVRAEADQARARFDRAEHERDVDACVAAVLDLEAAIAGWATDTLQSDDADYARRALRALVVRLGAIARVGARDPREALAPHVGLLLELRERARAARDFATSDLVRDRLGAAGVEVRDTPTGPQWALDKR